MGNNRTSIHGQWSTRWAFILAATGSAVGLGNIWKFPYITGENGGGAFVIVYLICIALVGIPIMMGEILLGRRGRQSPLNTMHTLAVESGKSPHWRWIGGAGIVGGFLILSFYSVIAGWALAYVFRIASGMFVGVTADGVKSIFSALTGDPERLIAWHTVFMGMTMIVVARGVQSGLEKAVRLLMPALFILLIVLVGYAMNTGAFMDGVNFLFTPEWDKLKPGSVLVAMGHAFFTLSLGMGSIMVYGSYLPRDTSIAKASITIALMDTLVALVAGMAIFPIVFANGLEPGAGPGLIFQTLPIAFGQMPGGTFFGTLFFILIVFAAWTSAISLIEPAVAWLVENHNMDRVYATVVACVTTWLLGLLTVFSFNILSDYTPLDMIDRFKDKTLFDLIDGLTANIMLPAGGLLVAVFATWIMAKRDTVDELDMGEGKSYQLWRFVTRYIAPVLVVMVFLNAIGILQL